MPKKWKKIFQSNLTASVEAVVCCVRQLDRKDEDVLG
jgi:hypothetical protein